VRRGTYLSEVGIHRRAPSSATFAGKQKPTLRIAVRE